MQLEDRVAIVTGGARGIGVGIARCLAAEGAKVALVDVDGTGAEATAATLGTEVIALAADASREADMAAATDRTVEHFGGLDIFVNNAGGASPDGLAGTGGIGNPFTRITEAAWDEQLATNLRTTFAGSKAAIPHLKRRGGGAIVNIASIAGLIPIVATPAYGAAKAGVVSLTRSLALELASDRIRVNAICPGLLWTRAWETLAERGLALSLEELRDLALGVLDLVVDVDERAAEPPCDLRADSRLPGAHEPDERDVAP